MRNFEADYCFEYFEPDYCMYTFISLVYQRHEINPHVNPHACHFNKSLRDKIFHHIIVIITDCLIIAARLRRSLDTSSKTTIKGVVFAVGQEEKRLRKRDGQMSPVNLFPLSGCDNLRFRLISALIYLNFNKSFQSGKFFFTFLNILY